MLIDAILMGMLMLLCVPAIGGHFALSRGRSFWLWFFISCFLPGISYFILILLPDKSNPVEKELEDLRIQNGMLGINPDAPVYQKKKENVKQ